MNKEEILEKLNSNPLLRQMYKIDQKKVDEVIDFALQCTDPIFKPVHQDILVRMITGSEPDRYALAHHASAQERALIDFVDGLLPDMPDNEEDEEDVICDNPVIIQDRGIYL